MDENKYVVCLAVYSATENNKCPYSSEILSVKQYGVIIVIDEIVYQLGCLCNCCKTTRYPFSVDTQDEAVEVVNQTDKRINEVGLKDLILIEVPGQRREVKTESSASYH